LRPLGSNFTMFTKKCSIWMGYSLVYLNVTAVPTSDVQWLLSI
jgi:hypothetical protein